MDELASDGAPSTSAEAAELAVRYVRFALARPALFRLMFGRPCDDRDDDRVRASGALHAYLADAMGTLYPGADAAALATAGWSLAHGLAFLHLDGKLDNADRAAVDDRVRASLAVLLPPTPDTHDHHQTPARAAEPRK